MGEFSGRLSERVRFEGRDEVRGAAGDQLAGWAFRFERWALVEPVRRADSTVERGDAVHSARRWRVTIRDGVRPALGMRIRWRGLTLRPTGIEIDPEAPGRILILAEDDNSLGGADAEQP
jgi:head-tail adaptor